MDTIEKKLKQHMNHSVTIPYPNFDRMFEGVQQDKLRIVEMEEDAVKSWRGRRVAVIAGLSVALMATPVYAAITYDWTSILSSKTGIQAALDQGFGQTIEQSVTKNGITLTVHTAFTDENRTVLLYSLDPGVIKEGQKVAFKSIGLKDSKGSMIKGNYVQQWNAQLGVFQGYFETDWVMDESQTNVEFTLEDIRFMEDGQQSIAFDPSNPDTQEFSIEKDGIGTVSVQSFNQADGKVLLKSLVSYTDPQMKDWTWARLQAYDNNNEVVKETEAPIFGTSGATGEYMSQQVYSLDQLKNTGNDFYLAYDRELASVEGNWNMNVALSKNQLESSTYRESLNIPVEALGGGTKISEIVVTPTQVRLILTHDKLAEGSRYLSYQLDVGGTLLDGGTWYENYDPQRTELRFEMTSLDLASITKTPMTLIGKHRVEGHIGNETSVLLSGISDKPQSLTTSYDNYPITWTYYTKDNNLYVETQSSDSTFGGVNQTYYLDGAVKEYGTMAIVGLDGEGNNKRIDVYENFSQDELEIYVHNYLTEKPDDELRVKVVPGK